MVSDAYKRAEKAAEDKFLSSEKPTAFGQTDPRMFVLIGAGLLVVAVSGAVFYGDPPFYSGVLTGRNMLQHYRDMQGGSD